MSIEARAAPIAVTRKPTGSIPVEPATTVKPAAVAPSGHSAGRRKTDGQRSDTCGQGTIA